MKDIQVVFSEKTILLTSKFARKAQHFGSAESCQLERAVSLYPDYNIVVHTIKRDPTQEHYKGLTYEYMRQYIQQFEEKPEEILAELDTMIEISHCHSNSKRYPVIKSWFLDRYNNVAKFGIKETDEPFEEPKAA